MLKEPPSGGFLLSGSPQEARACAVHPPPVRLMYSLRRFDIFVLFRGVLLKMGMLGLDFFKVKYRYAPS